MKKETNKLNCPKCKKSMKLVATGRFTRVYRCKECKYIKVVEREDVNEAK